MAPDLLASCLLRPEPRGFSAALAADRAHTLEQLILLSLSQCTMGSVQSPFYNQGN